jgi:hypothetical protein
MSGIRTIGMSQRRSDSKEKKNLVRLDFKILLNYI